MECLGSQVLTDPDYRMPAVERVRQGWCGCEATSCGSATVTATGVGAVQGYAATEALIARRREGSDDPPVPTTRRVREDGTLVEVDLADSHFGRGPQRCPVDERARRLAEEALP